MEDRRKENALRGRCIDGVFIFRGEQVKSFQD